VGAHYMTREQKQMALRLKAKGLKLKDIARELNVTYGMVSATVYRKQVRQGRPDGSRVRADSAPKSASTS
jgi:orotate phosphoribosyltransferase-like protein